MNVCFCYLKHMSLAEFDCRRSIILKVNVPLCVRNDHIKAHVSSQTITAEGCLFSGNTQPNTPLINMNPDRI